MSGPKDIEDRWVGQYMLDGKQPVRAKLMDWAKWMETHHPVHVADDPAAGARVSTVFLGIDYQFYKDGPPLLFETMVFRPGDDGRLTEDVYQERCSTWEQAVEQHDRALGWVARMYGH